MVTATLIYKPILTPARWSKKYFFVAFCTYSGINVAVCLLIIGLLPGAMILLKGATFISIFYLFLLQKFYSWATSILGLFKGLRLSFCQIFQGIHLFPDLRLFRSLEYVSLQ